MDSQSAAYRTATADQLEPGDWRHLLTRGLVVPADNSCHILLPEDWEYRRWDAAAGTPKSLGEAIAAARARGEDPSPYGGDGDAFTVRALAAAAAGQLYVPWLIDAARLTGYPVFVEPGWDGRGHGGLRVLEVVVGHHTATPETTAGDYPSLRIVRDGRPDLPGPLAQLGLGRSGAVYVIANGLAYHAGVSQYAGYYDLNDEALGIEAEDSGDGRWTAAQLDAYPRLVAALLFYMRRPAERYCSHRTCALPAGRKVDPAGITDAWMQERVRWMLTDPLARIPRSETAMPTLDEIVRGILDTPIRREGGRTGNTSLRSTLAWLDANLDALKAVAGAPAALAPEQLEELKAAIVAAESDKDAEQVMDAVRAAFARAGTTP